MLQDYQTMVWNTACVLLVAFGVSVAVWAVWSLQYVHLLESLDYYVLPQEDLYVLTYIPLLLVGSLCSILGILLFRRYVWLWPVLMITLVSSAVGAVAMLVFGSYAAELSWWILVVLPVGVLILLYFTQRHGLLNRSALFQPWIQIPLTVVVLQCVVYFYIPYVLTDAQVKSFSALEVGEITHIPDEENMLTLIPSADTLTAEEKRLIDSLVVNYQWFAPDKMQLTLLSGDEIEDYVEDTKSLVEQFVAAAERPLVQCPGSVQLDNTQSCVSTYQASIPFVVLFHAQQAADRTPELSVQYSLALLKFAGGLIHTPSYDSDEVIYGYALYAAAFSLLEQIFEAEQLDGEELMMLRRQVGDYLLTGRGYEKYVQAVYARSIAGFQDVRQMFVLQNAVTRYIWQQNRTEQLFAEYMKEHITLAHIDCAAYDERQAQKRKIQDAATSIQTINTWLDTRPNSLGIIMVKSIPMDTSRLNQVECELVERVENMVG